MSSAPSPPPSVYVPLRLRKRLAEEKIKGKISKFKFDGNDENDNEEGKDKGNHHIGKHIIEDQNLLNGIRQLSEVSNPSPSSSPPQFPSPSLLTPSDTPFKDPSSSSSSSPSLIDIALSIRNSPSPPTESAESALLRHVTQGRAPLLGVKDTAKGVKYTEPMDYGWRPLSKYLKLTPMEIEIFRKRHGIAVSLDGKKRAEDVGGGGGNPQNSQNSVPSDSVALSVRPCVPPVIRFADLRLPPPFLSALSAKGISAPTAIQKQGIPTILSGRDMVGIANTGQGKSIAFVIPMILIAMRAEMKLPLQKGEGPIGMIIAPSRELAKQIYDVAQHFNSFLTEAPYKKLNIILLIGGMDTSQEISLLQSSGVHCVVATPGRLLEFLQRHRFSLSFCQYVALDEADRLIDFGFDETVKQIFNFFESQRQTVLFSATMPKKIQQFAVESLISPVVVNVAGRAGAANLNITQTVECVEEENRFPMILETLQKTAPPVLIFSSNADDVDKINEFLLLRGVSSVSIHGRKSQPERLEAIDSFKNHQADVLVATDVASKGLDFPLIQHVINFEMPKEIEDYIHRIGRTGRGKEKGISTTFITQDVEEDVLSDLVHVLREAKQVIPSFLSHLNSVEMSNGKPVECPYCGGLGHSLENCRKLREENLQKQRAQRNFHGRDEGF